MIDAFAIAGTAEDCLAAGTGYRCAGVDELALTFAGSQPEVDMAYLGAAVGGGDALAPDWQAASGCC